MMRVSVFLLVLFLGISCTRKSKVTEPALARVGSSVLTVEEAREAIPDHILATDSTVAFQNYRDRWIEQQIIIQEAYRLRVHRQPDVQRRIQMLTDDYITKAAQEYIIGEIDTDLTVSDEEARSYYQQYRESFVLEERYIRYRHIIAASLSDAQQARVDLSNGVAWETVANRYCINPEVTIRQSERFWPESTAASDVDVMNRYLRVIGLTERSVIERVGNRYHFVQLMEERAKGEHPDLDWLIDQIKEWLVLEKRRKAFNTYVKNLYLQAQANNEIETFDVVIQN